MIPGMKMTMIHPSSGYNFKSKFEKTFSQGLLLLKKRGLISDWHYEEVTIPYKLEHTYVTDFRLTGLNGKMMFIETKGYFKSKDRTKHKKIREQHPYIDIRFIFMNSSTKLNKKSSTTYGSWCTKHGFKYADREIPKEWIYEINEWKE